MFETPDTKEKSSGTGMWIGVALVVVIVAICAYFFMKSSPAAKTAGPAAAPASSTPQANADAVHDLRIVSAKMDKDTTGNVAVWSVDIKNRPPRTHTAASPTQRSISPRTTASCFKIRAGSISASTPATNRPPSSETRSTRAAQPYTGSPSPGRHLRNRRPRDRHRAQQRKRKRKRR